MVYFQPSNGLSPSSALKLSYGYTFGVCKKKHDKYQQTNQLLSLKGTIFTLGTQIIGSIHLQTLVTKVQHRTAICTRTYFAKQTK
jgi:hypothetical protein